MKYFTKDYYPNENPNSYLYYKYIEQNFRYYPRWFVKYDVLNNGRFIFHDSQIINYKNTNKGFVINCRGLDYINDMPFSIIIKQPKIIELPDNINNHWILAEELYCSENSMELHFLIEDGCENNKGYLTIAGTSILFEYSKAKFVMKKISYNCSMYKEIITDYLRNK